MGKVKSAKKKKVEALLEQGTDSDGVPYKNLTEMWKAAIGAPCVVDDIQAQDAGSPMKIAAAASGSVDSGTAAAAEEEKFGSRKGWYSIGAGYWQVRHSQAVYHYWILIILTESGCPCQPRVGWFWRFGRSGCSGLPRIYQARAQIKGCCSLWRPVRARYVLIPRYCCLCSYCRFCCADCGAGIGRVTRELLLPLFQRVDLVEQCAQFVETARAQLPVETVPNVRSFVFLLRRCVLYGFLFCFILCSLLFMCADVLQWVAGVHAGARSL